MTEFDNDNFGHLFPVKYKHAHVHPEGTSVKSAFFEVMVEMRRTLHNHPEGTLAISDKGYI